MKLSAKVKIIIALVVVVLILNWDTVSDMLKTGNVTGSAVVEPSYEEQTAPPNVYFCPADDCIGEMLAWLDAAEESIHCALFEIGLEELRAKLLERSTEIDVKVVTDNNYRDEVADLDFVRDDNRSALMHNKFCVLDGKAVWTGSYNPTSRGTHKNNNNVVFYQSWYLAQNYENEFAEMWGGKFGGGERTLYPETKINGNVVETY
ncbi:MAG: phospholipase D-like domain-containing protein, partial [Candidatus Woesearchaeota archaeon]